jgi:hypothetical protein
MVNLFSSELHRRASDQRAAAAVMLESVDLGTEPKKQVTAIVGFCTANVLDALADVLDYLRESPGLDAKMAERRKIMERNDAIRRAAAKGDWAEFDRLVGDSGPAPGTGS